MSKKSRQKSAWTHVFHQMVERNLSNSIAMIEKNLARPEIFQAHFESLMRQAQWGYQSCPTLSASLLLSMHPWPARWAMIYPWLTQLELATNAPDLPLSLQKQILACMADVYKVVGFPQKVIEIAEGLFFPPPDDPQEYATLVTLTGGAWILALTSQGKLAEAEEILQKMEQYLADHPVAAPTVEFGMANAIIRVQKSIILRRQRNVSQALETITDAIQQLDQNNPRTYSLLYQMIETRAVFYRTAGNYAAALADLDNLYENYVGKGENLARSSLHGNRGLCYLSMCRYQEAEHELLRAIEIAEIHKAYSLMSRQLAPLSIIPFARGDIESALKLSERHMEVAIMIDDTPEKILAHANYSCMLVYADQSEKALPNLLAGLNETLAQGHQEWVIYAHFDLAICYYKLSEQSKVEHHAQQAYDISQGMDNKIIQMLAMRILALSQDAYQARELLIQALQIAKEFDRYLDQAGCLLFLAYIETDPVLQIKYWNDGKLFLEKIGATKWLENKNIGDSIVLPAML